MANDIFVLGDSNAICDVCGFKHKQSQLRKRWDGAMVCDKDWEHRHPQDMIRPRPEVQHVQNARVEPAPRYLSANEVQPGDL